MVIEAIKDDQYRTMPLAVRFDEWMGTAGFAGSGGGQKRDCVADA